MADYYSQFSTYIPYRTRPEQLWLLAQLEAQDTSAEDDGPYCTYEHMPKDQAVWVYSEEACNIDGLADLVARFQTRFASDTPWILEWANTCSRPILDSFSGGAVVVYKGTIHSICLHDLATRWIAKQINKETRAQRRPSQETTHA